MNALLSETLECQYTKLKTEANSQRTTWDKIHHHTSQKLHFSLAFLDLDFCHVFGSINMRS